ncbi:MAG: ComEC/Rec2 family competence protein [Clostridia bacterium]|nr:ComEC/Rec2 family competence protein [Clostridia bacterium]
MTLRRPLVPAALALGAGIASARIGGDPVAAGILALSAGIGGLLLFYFVVRCQILSVLEYGTRRVRLFLLIHAGIFLIGLLAGRAALGAGSLLDTESGQASVINGRVLSAESREDGRLLLEVMTCGAQSQNGKNVDDVSSGADGAAGKSTRAGSADAANRRGASEKVLVTLGNPEGPGAELTGCVVKVRGIPEKPSGARIPRGFDYSLYLRSRGILATLKADSGGIQIIKSPKGLWFILNRLALIRADMRHELTARMDEASASAFCGILFGESGSMDRDILQSYRQNGIGHILAASGLHVGFVYGLLRLLFRRPRTFVGNIPITAALLAYAALAGFSASVMRAVLMMLVHIMATLSHRRYDFLSCIAFCFIALLLFRPAYLFSNGFQLSFLAVTTLAVVLKKVENIRAGLEKKRREKTADGASDINTDSIDSETNPLSAHTKPLNANADVRTFSAFTDTYNAETDIRDTKTNDGAPGSIQTRSAVGSALMSLKGRVVTGLASLTAIQAGMLPMTVSAFHYVSPAVVVLNAPAILITGLIVPLGILILPLEVAARLALLPAPADMLLTFLCRMSALLIHALTGLSSIAGSSPLSFRYAASPPLFLTLLYYFALFLSCSEALSIVRKKLRRAAHENCPDTPAASVSRCAGRKSRDRNRTGPAPPDSGSDCDRTDSTPANLKSHRRAAHCSDPDSPSTGSPPRAPGRRIAAALTITALILSLGIWTASDWKYLSSDAVFLDVGQGDCIHLRGSGGFNMMIDSGGSDKQDVGTETLIPYFLSHGIASLDLAVITHLHTDHYAGLTTMTDGVQVKRLALSEGYRSQIDRVTAETGIPPENILFLKRGDVLRPGGGITLTVLSPPARSPEEYLQFLEADDENALSLVIRADVDGKSFLFTGDIGEDAEAEMISSLRSELLDVDVLKVAHHGSKTSSSQAFLDIASPEISVIQVGRRNMYGHPTPEALKRLARTGSRIFRTDRDGSVML